MKGSASPSFPRWQAAQAANCRSPPQVPRFQLSEASPGSITTRQPDISISKSERAPGNYRRATPPCRSCYRSETSSRRSVKLPPVQRTTSHSSSTSACTYASPSYGSLITWFACASTVLLLCCHCNALIETGTLFPSRLHFVLGSPILSRDHHSNTWRQRELH